MIVSLNLLSRFIHSSPHDVIPSRGKDRHMLILVNASRFINIPPIDGLSDKDDTEIKSSHSINHRL